MILLDIIKKGRWKKIFWILLVYVLTSCNKSNNTERKESQFVTQKNNETLNTSNNEKSSLLDEDIDVKNIKSQLDGVTTTFLSKTNVSLFPDRGKNNFYGYYTLIKNDKVGDSYKYSRKYGHLWFD